VQAALAFKTLGSIFGTASYALLYTYFAGIYPTNLTASIFGLCATADSMGTFLALGLEPVYDSIPILPGIIYGSFAFIAAAILLAMPEKYSYDTQTAPRLSVMILQKDFQDIVYRESIRKSKKIADRKSKKISRLEV